VTTLIGYIFRFTLSGDIFVNFSWADFDYAASPLMQLQRMISSSVEMLLSIAAVYLVRPGEV
jgi:hypothetical protein